MKKYISTFLMVMLAAVPVFAQTVDDHAKAKKGALTYASAGNGQGAHLGMELLKTLGGFDAVHVPYNGIGPAAVALVSGQVEVALLTPPTTVPLMKAGKLKVLALTGPKRLASLADVPTVAESGFPGFIPGDECLIVRPNS